jgi:hypothetical protein
VLRPEHPRLRKCSAASARRIPRAGDRDAQSTSCGIELAFAEDHKGLVSLALLPTLATQPRDFIRDDPRAVLGFNEFIFVRRIFAAGISPHVTASCGAGFRSYSTHALQTGGPRNLKELYPGLREESAIGLEVDTHMHGAAETVPFHGFANFP